MLAVVKALRTNVILDGPDVSKILKLLKENFKVISEPVTDDTLVIYEETNYFKKRKKNLPGIIINGARHKLNLTQKELSKQTGISQGRISEYEQGKRKIKNIETAKKLAQSLKISYTYLL